MEDLSSEGFCRNGEGSDAFSGGEGQRERDECICMLFRVEVGFGQGHHMSLLRLDVFSGCKGRAAT